MMKGRNQQEAAHALVSSRFMQEIMLPERFFQQEAEQIARACRAITCRLQQGGCVIAIGNSPCTAGVHRALALLHPLSADRQGLPLPALTRHSAPLDGAGYRSNSTPYTLQLQEVARAQDIALAFTVDGQDNDVLSALTAAQEMNLLTVGLCGGDGGGMAGAGLDFCFMVPGDHGTVQHIHEMLYQVLWEVVTTFYAHKRFPF